MINNFEGTKDDMKKLKIFLVLVILLSIASIGAAWHIKQERAVNPVEGFQVTGNTTDTVSIQWNKVEKASGYYVYHYNNASGKYELLTKIEGADTCQYDITGIGSAVTEKIEIQAYKNFMKKEYRSDVTREYVVYTFPANPQLSACSNENGILNMEWSTSDTIEGYELQYGKSEDFSDAQTEEFDSATQSYTVEDLEENVNYYSRVRTYYTVEGNKIYSDWSETVQTEIYYKELNLNGIDPMKPMVALSFDDGPAYNSNGSNSTQRILNVLEQYGVKATFFMVGERVSDKTKTLLQKELEIGCELGNHTYSHDHYGKSVTAEDISKASEQIKAYSGQAPTMFRCPGGNVTDTIREECKKEGMPLAYWSVDTEDWKSKNADSIYNRIMSGVYDGSIILMHDIYSTTADAVERAVPALIEQGYQIVTVSELIAAKSGEAPKAGEQYVDYNSINNNTH